MLTWQRFLTMLNSTAREIEKEDDNPPVKFYHSLTGQEFKLTGVYTEDGIVCIDVQPDES